MSDPDLKLNVILNEHIVVSHGRQWLVARLIVGAGNYRTMATCTTEEGALAVADAMNNAKVNRREKRRLMEEMERA